jgi:hypothetical protein
MYVYFDIMSAFCYLTKPFPSQLSDCFDYFIFSLYFYFHFSGFVPPLFLHSTLELRLTLLIKGTVPPDWICPKLFSLNSLWFGHATIYLNLLCNYPLNFHDL